MMNFHDNTMPRPRRSASRVAAHIGMAILFGTAFVLVLGYVVMMLWNGVMPMLFRVGAITFWQGIGLLLLARILVGGFHHGGHGRGRWGHRRDSRRQYEEWWREVGEQSFRDYSATNTSEKG
jgi:hypothetical protein